MDIEYEQCLIFQKRRFKPDKNETSMFELTHGHEGIPELLLINVASTVVQV